MSLATWMVVATNPPDPRKTLVLLDYINLSLAQTRSKEQELDYIPIPSALELEVKRELNEIAAGFVQQVNSATAGQSGMASSRELLGLAGRHGIKGSTGLGADSWGRSRISPQFVK